MPQFLSIQTIHLSAGEILYSKGDIAKDVYVIAQGQMAMFHSNDEIQHTYEIREQGGVLGALSILTGFPRHVGTRAITDVTLFKIHPDQILRDFDRIDPLLRECIETAITFNHRLLEGAPPNHDGRNTPKERRDAAKLVLEKYSFEVDLLNSIASNDFSMVYQPIVTLQTADVVGFEALMRWTHPTRGFVPPDIFIAVAEQMGVIGSLTELAMTQSCLTLQELQKRSGGKRRYFASVNISGHDVARKGFADQLAYILDDHDIAPEQIKLEVTETAIIPNTQTVADNLAAFQSLGCGLSIDDFGTGYSNLAHLKSLPLSALKIDRAFAGDAHKNHVSCSIVSMLVSLGHALNVDIVAEGVETDDDVKALSDLGCNFAQGYFFHRPASKDDLIHLLTPDHGPSGWAGVA